jgi:hypothetical protein
MCDVVWAELVVVVTNENEALVPTPSALPVLPEPATSDAVYALLPAMDARRQRRRRRRGARRGKRWRARRNIARRVRDKGVGRALKRRGRSHEEVGGRCTPLMSLRNSQFA